MSLFFRSLLLFSLFSLPLLPSKAQALSGNYRLHYLNSSLQIRHLENKSLNQSFTNFDFSELSSPPQLDVLYFLHNAKGPSATLTGAGIPKPRECGDNTETLPSQKLKCEPFALEQRKDEETGCELATLSNEVITFSIADNLRYARSELILFKKETKNECLGYLKQLEMAKLLDLKNVEISDDNFPDALILTHWYQMGSVSDYSAEILKGVYSGTYQARYTGKSQSLSWLEDKDETPSRLKEGPLFNAAREPLFVQDLPEVLLFHDTEKNSLEVAGGGSNKIRKCRVNEDKSSDDTSVFECSLFKAKEEELGTGCTIEHRIEEEIILQKGQFPQYSRLEKRKLIESEGSHCELYKEKIAEELADNRAEIFFQAVFANGGIESPQDLSNTFVLKHIFELRAPPSEF